MASFASIILGGGHSIRFGQDKAHVQWRDRSFLEHVLEAIPEDCSEIILVVREDQLGEEWPSGFRAVPVRVVADDPGLPEGPLRGVVRGLESSNSHWNLVLACDLPGLSSAIPSRLCSELRADDIAIVPEFRGRLQPLCALYARRASADLRHQLETGTRSLIEAVRSLDIRVLDEDSIAVHDPQGLSFLNINTPEDLVLLEGLSPHEGANRD